MKSLCIKKSFSLFLILQLFVENKLEAEICCLPKNIPNPTDITSIVTNGATPGVMAYFNNCIWIVSNNAPFNNNFALLNASNCTLSSLSNFDTWGGLPTQASVNSSGCLATFNEDTFLEIDDMSSCNINTLATHYNISFLTTTATAFSTTCLGIGGTDNSNNIILGLTPVVNCNIDPNNVTITNLNFIFGNSTGLISSLASTDNCLALGGYNNNGEPIIALAKINNCVYSSSTFQKLKNFKSNSKISVAFNGNCLGIAGLDKSGKQQIILTEISNCFLPTTIPASVSIPGFDLNTDITIAFNQKGCLAIGGTADGKPAITLIKLIKCTSASIIRSAIDKAIINKYC